MRSVQQDEVERKFDVDAATPVPLLAGLDGVDTISQPVELHLEAVYFDTADLVLARHGVTVRRRTGGEDAGWHLKTPKRRDTRSELRLPLGRATKTVPGRLVAPVRALVRDHRLVPVARVSTLRLEHALLDADGVVLAQLCDDRVHAERLLGEVEVDGWREWEVELVHGDQGVLDAVDGRLRSAGAVPALAASKLARSLGDALPPAHPGKGSRKQISRGRAGQVLLAHVAKHIAVLHRQDSRLRAGEPDAVHKFRISARRLRSALTTYRSLLAPGAADSVVEDLRWLGQTLSEARDAQVLREHLHLMVDAEPPDLVLGPVLNLIDDALRAVEAAGQERALIALDSERYFRLLDGLDELVASAPLVPEADAPAREALPRLLQRDVKRLRRAVRQIAHSENAEMRDKALHDARKKAKRLRYAAEVAIPVVGGRAEKLSASAKTIQETLGRHHDTVMAREALRQSSVLAHDAGENGFTFGRLHALEQARGDEAEHEFETAWSAFPRKKLRR